MIRKLRFKFIAVTMTSIGCLLLLILLVINIFMNVSSRSQGYRMLEGFSRDFGQTDDAEPEFSAHPQPPRDPAYQDAFRIFSVSCDADGNPLQVSYLPDSELEREDILAIFRKAVKDWPKSRPERGIVQSRYLYLVSKQDGFWQIYFLDYSVERSMVYRLFFLCLLAGSFGIAVLFAAVFLLSGWMVRPVEAAFEKQKQFIADASHELKTPLTILSANAEVLSASLGPNRWLTHILEQTQRMNTLIRELLDLARLDSGTQKADFVPFDLSRCCLNAALSFESVAFESCISLRTEITEGISLTGSENMLRQLVTILLDNAFKYADEGGMVKLSLRQKGEKRLLSVYNTGKGIPQEEQAHIFERFYRSDSSRSRESGGYGLGLAIASSITAAHGGQISVSSDGKSFTKITVTLPPNAPSK
ncbi:MAG: HAMP domain-containing sensor histidine kinase [Eubacteriales bacterium]|nr:HAMP domain-containing sensor histidine kinase [Eubacteriales bacterium]